MVGLKLNKYDYFCTLEVVGRGRETQLQVGEKLKFWKSSGFKFKIKCDQ